MKTLKVLKIESNNFGDQIVHWEDSKHNYQGITVNYEGNWENIQIGDKKRVALLKKVA